MHMVSSPFTCSVDNASRDVQIELIDLQSDTLLSAFGQFHCFTFTFIPSLKRRTFHTRGDMLKRFLYSLDLHMYVSRLLSDDEQIQIQ